MTDPRPETLDREALTAHELDALFAGLKSLGWREDLAKAHVDAVRERLLAAEQRAKEAERYQAALEDFRDRGLRCDLTPTMRLDDPRETYMALVNYLRRQDGAVRERARRALAPHKAAEEETDGLSD